MSGRPGSPALVIFDAFKTLVRPVPGFENTFTTALAALGVRSSSSVIADLQSASEGLDHWRWSGSREAYSQWTYETLTAGATDLLDGLAPHVVPALEQWHQAPMEPFPDVAACLATLRSATIKIAVCSNWGWDLADDLTAAGLAGMIDFTISSAQAGCRKPHQDIYQIVLDRAGVRAADAVFVGDSLRADVLAPQEAGIYSVHLDRAGAGSHGGAAVTSLTKLAVHLGLVAAATCPPEPPA